MAGLCEGGNEPSGSLKAISEARIPLPLLLGSHSNYFVQLQLKPVFRFRFLSCSSYSILLRNGYYACGEIALRSIAGPGMRAAPFSRPELLSHRKALQFQARAERSRSGGLTLQLPSLH
ncbi:hypothetical protein ANN_17536 [Periplaneta americana]|uniref:Uncharacterized protein n=1 Tax=Periplaneta americana TaxID=6978 RepID=A0ABQ8SUM7_PERAM|nr:hypothetical protein ANN_17536 [Periplaneta americana]